MHHFRFGTPACVAALALTSLACSGTTSDPSANDPSAADEGALETRGAKVLARNLEHPAGLAVTDKYAFFSQNHFVASGDPELDQEYAYWEGKYSRVPVNGGAREKIHDDGIVRVRTVNGKILGATGSSCWITSFDANAAHPQATPLYTDETCEEYGPVGFEATASKFVVLTAAGNLMVGKVDGTNMKKVGAFSFGDTIPFLKGETLADGKIFALTDRSYNGHAKQTLFSMPLTGGAQTKVMDFDANVPQPDLLTSDGTNVFFAQGKQVFILARGTNVPKLLSEDFGSVTDLVSDGTNLVVGDRKRGAVYAIKDAASAPKHVKVIDVKGLEALAIAGGKVYFATHAIVGRKATGILASIALP